MNTIIAKLIMLIREALKDYPHEIIVVDDESSDGTIDVAKKSADVAVTKPREGQTKGLLYGIKLAKYPIIVTIDSDLENDPKHIPELVDSTRKFDVVNASRTELPRIYERFASKTLGKTLGVTDTFSNYRAFKKELLPYFELSGGETFGAEFLVIAKKHGLTIGDLLVEAPPRRKHPRIGGTVKANLRIFWALIKLTAIYVT